MRRTCCRAEVAGFGADMTVVATAPSYLFWRCAPPELRVPARFLRTLGPTRRPDGGGRAAWLGHAWRDTAQARRRCRGARRMRGGHRGACRGRRLVARALDCLCRSATAPHHRRRRRARFVDLPPLAWPDEWIERHRHHHHRFDEPRQGPGAEVEASRGCPYTCSFCAKIDYRDEYRAARICRGSSRRSIG